MAGTEEFIKQYGDVSFTQLPFCDADNVALCQAFYMPLENVVSSDFSEPAKDFSDVCNSLFAYNGCKHRPLGLLITKQPSVRLMEMSERTRYSEMKVIGCTESFSQQPAVQFAAATFLLPDNTKVIIFRGTDDTLAGWKEDIDIFIYRGIPSYRLAINYINKVADEFDGDLIVCGHSKGGNVALYAALNCSENARSRIVKLYNNDGPGFADYALFKTPQYREMLPRYKHFVPYSSFVGMLLFHDDDYTVINSNKLLGMLQHDLDTWQIDGCELETKQKLSALGKITDMSLSTLFGKFTSEQMESADKVFTDLIAGSGQVCLKEFAKNAVSSVKGMVDAWHSLDDTTRGQFKDAFSGVTGIIKDSAVKVLGKKPAEQTVPEAQPVAVV